MKHARNFINLFAFPGFATDGPGPTAWKDTGLKDKDIFQDMVDEYDMVVVYGTIDTYYRYTHEILKDKVKTDRYG